DDATLMSFAAGSLPAALSAVAATHVAMCPRCRREVAGLERVGAALLFDLPPATLNRTDPPASAATALAEVTQPGNAGGTSPDVPKPLARLLGGGLDTIRWRWLGFGVWHHPLRFAGRGGLGLLKVAPRRVIPEHG